jgi:hypothetical protein
MFDQDADNPLFNMWDLLKRRPLVDVSWQHQQDSDAARGIVRWDFVLGPHERNVVNETATIESVLPAGSSPRDLVSLVRQRRREAVQSGLAPSTRPFDLPRMRFHHMIASPQPRPPLSPAEVQATRTSAVRPCLILSRVLC